MSARKELDGIIRRARKQGWTVDHRRRSGHLVFRNPGGDSYFTGASPSDWRAARKLEADLAKLGYEKAGNRR